LPKIAVHVGAHKTGTSLVQKYLRDQVEQTAPFDIRYVSRSDTDRLIGWGMTLLERPEKLRARLEAESRDVTARYIIVSHENTLGRPHRSSGDNLYPEALPRIDALASILAPFDSRIVFYLRRTADFLESYYLQLIQQGEFFGFEQWLDRVDLDRVSWTPLVERLRDRFGHDNVAIGDFDEIKLGQGEFLRRFFRRVDPRIDLTPSYEERRNSSLSDKGLRIAMGANRFLRSGGERQRMRKFLQQHFSNVDYPRPSLFDPGQRKQIGERYDAEYERLIDPP
jgi:hypothetical protein